MKFSTKAIHVGQEADKSTGATITPIYQTTTFTQCELGKHKGFEYSRTENPTRAALEECLASLENGKYGLAFASGCAATCAVLSLVKTGEHVIVFEEVYGGTYRLFKKLADSYNIKFSFIKCCEVDKLSDYYTPKTRLIWFETPTNPLLSIIDIEKVATFAKKKKIISVLDNTFATPYFQNPINFGIDIVVHSTTKYIGGHSDVIGGAVVTSSKNYYDDIKFYQNSAGGVPGILDSWLILRGIKTLSVRMKKHEENAKKIADFLLGCDKVKNVYYPALKSFKYHETAKKQMSGYSGMLSFELDIDMKGIKIFLSSLKIISLAESLGGVESLISHPATMTHASFPEQKRLSMGITDNLLRLSVGIEDHEDLINDLKRAMKFTNK